MRGRSDDHVGQRTPVIGIVGWKNSGKTTLVERLIAAFTARGLTVATVKHAHHSFAIDDAATDSARHRRAGARQVAIVSSQRVALVRELEAGAEPTLTEILARLEPADLVIVEGYKRAAIPKIEVRRSAALTREPLAGSDPHVLAIAADYAIADAPCPVLALDDIEGLVALIAQSLGLPAKAPG